MNMALAKGDNLVALVFELGLRSRDLDIGQGLKNAKAK